MSDWDDDGYDNWREELAEERYEQGIADHLDDLERDDEERSRRGNS